MDVTVGGSSPMMCTCDVFRVLINSLCLFYTSALGSVLFQIKSFYALYLFTCFKIAGVSHTANSVVVFFVFFSVFISDAVQNICVHYYRL